MTSKIKIFTLKTRFFTHFDFENQFIDLINLIFDQKTEILTLQESNVVKIWPKPTILTHLTFESKILTNFCLKTRIFTHLDFENQFNDLINLIFDQKTQILLKYGKNLQY